MGTWLDHVLNTIAMIHSPVLIACIYKLKLFRGWDAISELGVYNSDHQDREKSH